MLISSKTQNTHTHGMNPMTQNVFFQEQFYYLVFVIILRVPKKAVVTFQHLQ